MTINAVITALFLRENYASNRDKKLDTIGTVCRVTMVAHSVWGMIGSFPDLLDDAMSLAAIASYVNMAVLCVSHIAYFRMKRSLPNQGSSTNKALRMRLKIRYGRTSL